jgi:hypothetical protein
MPTNLVNTIDLIKLFVSALLSTGILANQQLL